MTAASIIYRADQTWQGVYPPGMEYHWSPRRGALDDHQHSARLSTVGLRKPSVEVTLFDIEKDGDPRIGWYMYYDFLVNKHEAYYQLQPGYLPTESFPRRRKSEPITTVKGSSRYPCRAPRCVVEPFLSHAELERHFRTVHENSSREIACDYADCTLNPARSFPAAKIQDHYADYHREDLIRHLGDDAAQIDSFLAERLTTDHLDLSWWRCGRCNQRVAVAIDDYQCPRCKTLCEPERVAWRRCIAAEEAEAVGGYAMSLDAAYASDLF